MREANEIAAELRAKSKPKLNPEKCIATARRVKRTNMDHPLCLLIPETQAGIERMARRIK
jgi:hypothetical protein